MGSDWYTLKQRNDMRNKLTLQVGKGQIILIHITFCEKSNLWKCEKDHHDAYHYERMIHKQICDLVIGMSILFMV